MDELLKRCGTICGNRSGCFITNANHRECITDMVINKIWAAREIINLGTKCCAGEQMAALLNTATSEMDELVGWVQKIQDSGNGN